MPKPIINMLIKEGQPRVTSLILNSLIIIKYNAIIAPINRKKKSIALTCDGKNEKATTNRYQLSFSSGKTFRSPHETRSRYRHQSRLFKIQIKNLHTQTN